MKTKLFFLSLLFSGVCQFTTAFNVGDKISESSTALTLDSFTFADDATNLTITVNGDSVNAATHRLYIDTDNDSTTGDPDNGGADFRVENTGVNKWVGAAVGGSWVWEWHGGNVVVTNDPGVSVAFQITRSYLPLLNSGAQINVYFTNLLVWEPVVGERLPATGMESYTTTTGTPPPNLESLTISEDATTITMTILGPGIEPTYDIYIDTDNNTATGLATRAGADVLLQTGLSFDSTGTGWGWTEHTVPAINSVTDVAGVSRVMVLDKAILGLTGAGTTFNVIYENSGGSTDALPSVSFTTGTLSLESLVLDNVSIYKSSNSTLSINGLIQGKSELKLFNMLGKQVLSSSFTLNGTKDISLPSLSSGIYIVRLETEFGIKSKKIIL
jgi:hypothetical protein